MRWNADPDEVQRSVVENVGRALMQLEETVQEIAAKFGVPAEDLNLDLGPVGKLM